MYIGAIFDLFSCSLAFLDEHAKEMLNKKGGQWSPLVMYRNGLAGQDEEEEGMEKEKKYKSIIAIIIIIITIITSFKSQITSLAQTFY